MKESSNTASFEKIENLQQIMAYVVLSTLALAIDEKVMFSGKVPSVDEIKKLL